MGKRCTAALSPSLCISRGGWVELQPPLLPSVSQDLSAGQGVYPSSSPQYFLNKVVPGWQDLTFFPPHTISMKFPSLDIFGLPRHISQPLLPPEQAERSKRNFIAFHLPHLSSTLATLTVGKFLAENISPCSLLKEKDQKQDGVWCDACQVPQVGGSSLVFEWLLLMKLNNLPGSLGRTDSIARYELRADGDPVLGKKETFKSC